MLSPQLCQRLRRILRSNNPDAGVRQFRESIAFALNGGLSCTSGVVSATFALPITRIVRGCAEKQVIGTDTTRHVAVMANPQPWRDLAVVQHPRHAMGVEIAILQRDDAVVPAVDFMERRACPQPAAVLGLLDAAPKPLGQRQLLNRVAARLRTTLLIRFLARDSKLCAAVFAVARAWSVELLRAASPKLIAALRRAMPLSGFLPRHFEYLSTGATSLLTHRRTIPDAVTV